MSANKNKEIEKKNKIKERKNEVLRN